jgi:hypothetical protein
MASADSTTDETKTEQAKPTEQTTAAEQKTETKSDETYSGINKDVPDSLPDEELTVGQYIDRWFSRRKKNVMQLADDTNLTQNEVYDVLKQLGYHFAEGV